MTTKQGFDPSRSRVSADQMSNWIAAPVTGDLQEIPGLGQAGVKVLEANEIETTYQLFAKFLSLKQRGLRLLPFIVFPIHCSHTPTP